MSGSIVTRDGQMPKDHSGACGHSCKMSVQTTLQANCDTDQIIPARYLQKPRSDNFGAYVFADSRLGKDGAPAPELPFNQQAYASAKIVVAERNFGCGSSREHAVWALYDYGMRAVIAPSFGDIFKNNSLKNGLLPIELPEEVVTGLIAGLLANPGTAVTVDLPAQTVTLPDGSGHAFEKGYGADRS